MLNLVSNHVDLKQILRGSIGGGLELVITGETDPSWWIDRFTNHSNQFIVMIQPAYITLPSKTSIKGDHTVVTGIGAGAAGFGFKGAPLEVNSSYVCLDNLHLFGGPNTNRSNGDAFRISGANEAPTGLNDISDILITNCLFGHSRDEIVNPYYLCKNVSFQNCIFGLAAREVGRNPHDFGLSIGGGVTRVSIFDSLIVGCTRRMPNATGSKGPQKQNTGRRGEFYLDSVVGIRSTDEVVSRAFIETGEATPGAHGCDLTIDGYVAESFQDSEAIRTDVIVNKENPNTRASANKIKASNLHYDSWIGLSRGPDAFVTEDLWVPKHTLRSKSKDSILKRVYKDAGPNHQSIYSGMLKYMAQSKRPPILYWEALPEITTTAQSNVLLRGTKVGSNGVKSPDFLLLAVWYQYSL